MQDIVTDSRFFQSGDIFFCNEKAENFLSEEIIENAEKIYVISGFFERNRQFQNEKIEELSEKDFYEKLVNSLCKKYKKPEKLIAITGTKGKTSSCWFVFQFLTYLNHNVSYFGTIGMFFSINGIVEKIPEKDFEQLTTLSLCQMHKALDYVAQKGIKISIFETSSHGLHQGRIDGLEIDISCFTNFSQDHLDYHKTMEEYFLAKMILFEKYQKPGGIAILNKDIKNFEKLEKTCQDRKIQIITFKKSENDNLLYYKNKNCKTEEVDKNKFLFKHIIGDFQFDNLICAILIASQFGLNSENILEISKKISAPLGRMQEVKKNIFIDYAHTPASLKEALLTLNKIKNQNSRIICLFGCGGDRDKQKRPIMFEIAKFLSDFIIITSDNPRNEDSQEIINDILNKDNRFQNDEFVQNEIFKIKSEFKEKNSEIFVEIDRRNAIKLGLSLRNDNDIFLVAGKGHENYQIIGDKKFHFDDPEEISVAAF